MNFESNILKSINKKTYKIQKKWFEILKAKIGIMNLLRNFRNKIRKMSIIVMLFKQSHANKADI